MSIVLIKSRILTMSVETTGTSNQDVQMIISGQNKPSSIVYTSPGLDSNLSTTLAGLVSPESPSVDQGNLPSLPVNSSSSLSSTSSCLSLSYSSGSRVSLVGSSEEQRKKDSRWPERWNALPESENPNQPNQVMMFTRGEQRSGPVRESATWPVQNNPEQISASASVISEYYDTCTKSSDKIINDKDKNPDNRSARKSSLSSDTCSITSQKSGVVYSFSPVQSCLSPPANKPLPKNSELISCNPSPKLNKRPQSILRRKTADVLSPGDRPRPRLNTHAGFVATASATGIRSPAAQAKSAATSTVSPLMNRQRCPSLPGTRPAAPVDRKSSIINGAATIFNSLFQSSRLSFRRATSFRRSSRVSGSSALLNSYPQEDERIRINVSGQPFETFSSVLSRHPTTLLGDVRKRRRYYDIKRDEVFFDRHRPSFEAIFAYLQNGGRIRRPHNVPDDIFLSELMFFELEKDAVDAYKLSEGYTSEEMVLPSNPTLSKIWMLFEYPETSRLGFITALISVFMTLTSIVLFCLETLPKFSQSHCAEGEAPNFLDPFFVIETTCTLWFTFEAIIRFIACPNKIQFWKDFKNIVDVTAVIPYYITFFNVISTMSCSSAKSSASLAFLRVIRLVRVFKLTKHSVGLQVLMLTFKASLEGLCLFLIALIVCLLVFSSAIYYAELDQGEKSQISSIPDAFWWAIITMTTVGYGDKVPVGMVGKMIGSVCALTGVLTVAIPVPIITGHFNRFYAHKTGRGRIM